MKPAINIFLFCIVSTLLAVTAGCEKPHRKANFENLELTADFFASAEQRDAATAARRAERLQIISRDTAGLENIVAVLQSSEALKAADKLLQKNDVYGAAARIVAELKKYPDNQLLQQAHLQLTQLGNVNLYFQAMYAARRRGELAMRDALKAAETGTEKIRTPKLDKFFAEYGAEIRKLQAEGHQGSRDRERSAEREKLQAKIDEENLRSENIAFDSEVEKLIAEGEKASKEAVGKPAHEDKEKSVAEKENIQK